MAHLARTAWIVFATLAGCAPAVGLEPTREGAESASLDAPVAASAATATGAAASSSPAPSASSPATAPLSAFAARPGPAPGCLARCDEDSRRCDAGAAREKDARGQRRRCGCAKISCEEACERGGPPDFSCR